MLVANVNLTAATMQSAQAIKNPAAGSRGANFSFYY